MFDHPKMEICPVPRPSCALEVTTKEPPLMVTSPVKVLPVFVSKREPLPVLVRPAEPATTDETVARLPAETETEGVVEPTGAAKVSVLPVRVKSAPANTSPPTVKDEPSVTVPPVPMKLAVSLLASVQVTSFVPSNHLASVAPQTPPAPSPTPVEVLLPEAVASLSQ